MQRYFLILNWEADLNFWAHRPEKQCAIPAESDFIDLWLQFYSHVDITLFNHVLLATDHHSMISQAVCDCAHRPF